MSIGISGPINPIRGIALPAQLELIQGQESTKENFGEMLGNFLNSVQSMQDNAGDMQGAFLNGEATDLHEVMIAAEEAGISFDILLEIRNKVIEAYQEIVRMPL